MIRGLYHRESRLGAGGRSDLDDAGAHDFVDGGRLSRRGNRQCIWLRVGEMARDAEKVGYCRKDTGLVGKRRYSYSPIGYAVAGARCCILVNIP